MTQNEHSAEVELTIHIRDMDPLELVCTEDTPILATLFQALLNKHSSHLTDDVIYLQFEEERPSALYFRSSQLLAIEATPPLSVEFMSMMTANRVSSSTVGFDDTWKYWIWDSVNRGCTKESLFKVLIEKGFAYDTVRTELNYEPTVPLDQIAGELEYDRPAKESHFIPNAVRANTADAELYIVEDFLNPAECEHLVSAIKGDLTPSTTVGGPGVDTGRTSSSCYFENESFAGEIRLRICKLLGFNSSFAERLQGHLYYPGEEYKAHYDWFEPGSESFELHASADKGGQRTWTVLVYLNEVGEGGGTEFAHLNQTIIPKPGKLLAWNNLYPSGRPNPNVLHHALPVVSGEKAVLTLWFRSEGDGEMLSREPGEYIPNYTRTGYQHTTMPQFVFSKLREYFDLHQNAARKESIPDYIHGEHDTPSDLIELPHPLRVEISKVMRPILETWSGQELESTGVYGIRRYNRAATLKMHRDRIDTHIVSAILNIEQDVEEDWPLYIEDNYYRPLKITLQPGDMVLYEGARALHGRPTPLIGNHYCNVFVHFKLRDKSENTDDQIDV